MSDAENSAKCARRPPKKMKRGSPNDWIHESNLERAPRALTLEAITQPVSHSSSTARWLNNAPRCS